VPTLRLTQLAAERQGPPKSGRIIYWDRLLPGFGLRLTAKGARSWVAMYRVGGRSVMQTLGPMARLRVEEARQLARECMAKAASGTNPVAEKRNKARQAETAAAIAAANTMGAAARRYLAESRNARTGAILRVKTAREWRRIFEHDVLPRWGERPLAEITKADVLELVNDKAGRRERERKGRTDGAAVQAGKILARLRTFFAWAAANDLIAADPTAGVRKPAKEIARDRVLSDDEIRLFWQATDSLGPPFGALFRLLLLTAQRLSEVGGVRWSEISEDGIWEIPGDRAKNGKLHFVHLSPQAQEIIAALPRIAGQDLLFSGTGRTPASGISGAKDRLDLHMAALTEREIAPWTLHDLRRTVTTGLARLGIPPHVADRILNHQAGTIRGVAAVYNRFEYLEERKAALAAWGRYVEAITENSPQNVVVPLRRAGV
jgi:integrase